MSDDKTEFDEFKRLIEEWEAACRLEFQARDKARAAEAELQEANLNGSKGRMALEFFMAQQGRRRLRVL